MHTFGLLLITSLATARIVRLITTDVITHNFRIWVYKVTRERVRLFDFKDGSWRWYLLSCPWCVGIYISFAFTLTAWASAGYNWTGDDRYLVPAIALAISFLIGITAEVERLITLSIKWLEYTTTLQEKAAENEGS